MDLKTLINTDPRYKDVLRAIIDSPYIERSALEEKLDLSQADLESLLDSLSGEMIILELAGQADSSLESRVPKKVYLVNPEEEKSIRENL
ncbi:MAG TPA: hypothetical protein ENL23_04475 [Candidatus Acetothermia bacterium]|nr:hypothetical protein [Candidatus Acetothermia bacterium]